MGLIQIYNDVEANTGVKHYPDRSINPGTKAVYDAGAGGVYGGGKDVSAGAEIYSLTFSDSVATFSKSHLYQNGGMRFVGVGGDTFDLPAVAAPQPSDKHWLITQWLKIANFGVGTVGGNNQTFSFSTSNVNIVTASMLGMVPTGVAGASPSAIALYVRGRQYALVTQLALLFDGQPHQFAVECQISDDNTQQRIYVYLDQVQVYASGWLSVAATVPAAPTYRYVGTSASFPVAWTGSFYRYRKDELTATDKTTAEILAADKDVAGTRFS
ncbi:hypothetical protein ABLV20_15880 [Klebsiella sp. GG_Kp164]|uniref:hypothetical protein n=1 Tax=Klebsiella sp. GG_Kp164 TaxID=3153475 RepID=UPI0032B32374|nr:hypothetical protein [Raoultella ornithinolytica]HBU2513750.1 hypothetical protein [Klebsiella pneumoniae]HBU2593777.1 hypothetical protein [Klebsiella pneumoniae]HBU2776559.1 hypothetical protein [Klebsiella pneumoniae]